MRVTNASNDLCEAARDALVAPNLTEALPGLAAVAPSLLDAYLPYIQDIEVVLAAALNPGLAPSLEAASAEPGSVLLAPCERLADYALAFAAIGEVSPVATGMTRAAEWLSEGAALTNQGSPRLRRVVGCLCMWRSHCL